MTIKKASIILVILAVAAAAVIYFIVPKKSTETYTTEKAVMGDILQTVSETGTVKAKEDLNLSFPTGGKIQKIDVKVGDAVAPDQILVELDKSNLEIRRLETQASLDVAKNNLQKLQAGATKEDVAVVEAGSNQAQSAYDAAKRSYDETKKSVDEAVAQSEKTYSDLTSNGPTDLTREEQTVISAQDSFDNAKKTYQESIDNSISDGLVAVKNNISVANNALDNINRIITDDDGKDFISKQNPAYLSYTKQYRSEASGAISPLNSALDADTILKDQASTLKLLIDAGNLLGKTQSSLVNCYKALENSVTNSGFTQAKIDTFKSAISAQQTAVSAGISGIESVKQRLNDSISSYNTQVTAAQNALKQAQAAYSDAVDAAKNALSSAQTSRDKQMVAAQSAIDSAYQAWQVAMAQLKKIKAPANSYDVTLAQAQVRQADASLNTILKQIADCDLRSPAAGVVTKSDFVAGEQVMAGTAVVSVLSGGNFGIEVLVSEADIAKVKPDDSVEITLDAYGEDVNFPGKVIFIEPAETNVQDVIYYKVDISFDPDGKEIKSGMTANVTITTAEKKNVLNIPFRAVIDNGTGEKTVKLLVNNLAQEVKVEIGLKSDEGQVEVLSGVKEGDLVITYTTQK
jgi:HlyD family secretion protein